ncbi:MAG: alkaline phosphatase D family protein [Opitutales bacterium]
MINRRDFFKTAFVGTVGIGVLKTNGFSLFAKEASKALVFGEGNHPMKNDSHPMDIIRYWENVSQEDMDLYESALKVFEKDPKSASYAELIEDKAYLKQLENYDRKLLGKPMLANLRRDTVSLWLRTIKPQKVQVEYTDGSETMLSEVYETSVAQDLAVAIELKNLKSDKKYSYTIIIDGEKYREENFFFNSLPSGDKLRVAFGTCPHRWGLGNAKLFESINKRKPSIMLLYGDIAAQGKNNKLGLHRADYLLRDFQSVWSNFVCNIPVYANWDDHDYFSNDKSGIPNGYTDKDRRGVRQIFVNSWSNPYYGNGDEGIYTSFSLGDCDVIMTDNRYFREGEPTPTRNKKTGKIDEKALERSKTIKKEFLGKMQMQWLKDELTKAKGKFVILTCGTMWSDYVSGGKDSWGIYDPEGREEIYKLIEEKGIAGVLLLSGDRHGARVFSIDRKGFKLYEFGMASLGARICGGVGNKQWQEQLFNKQGIFAFGEFNFDMQEGNESVELNIIGEEGDILFNHKFSRKELSPPKA